MVTRLRAGVWQLDLRGVNAYLADERVLPHVDDGAVTLVDAGGPWSAGPLRDELRRADFDVDDLDRIFVTHFDVDHVGALAALDTDAPVYMGAQDVAFLTGDEKPVPGHLKGATQRLVQPFLSAPDQEVVPVADGDTVGTFTVYHTPGHTPGHVAYVSDALSVAFVGDLVRERDGRLVSSPWFISYDTERVGDSIHDLADRAPAVEVLAMGHGTPFVRDGSVRLAELGERLEAEQSA